MPVWGMRQGQSALCMVSAPQLCVDWRLLLCSSPELQCGAHVRLPRAARLQPADLCWSLQRAGAPCSRVLRLTSHSSCAINCNCHMPASEPTNPVAATTLPVAPAPRSHSVREPVLMSVVWTAMFYGPSAAQISRLGNAGLQGV